jgi:hypothetical protein
LKRFASSGWVIAEPSEWKQRFSLGNGFIAERFDRWNDSMNSALSMPDPSPTETFAASRWTQGNFLFTTKLVISPQRVSRVKSRMFGSNEESIAISKIASVRISSGVFWAEIVIESTGGTDPIVSHGHRKKDAQRIRDLIEQYQAQARA